MDLGLVGSKSQVRVQHEVMHKLYKVCVNRDSRASLASASGIGLDRRDGECHGARLSGPI